MKRDKYDAVVSDLVRERAHWTCERCGIVDADGQARGKSYGMHCSHFFGRGAGNCSRYDTDLLTCLCASCHKYLGDRPNEHTAFIIKKVGETFLEMTTEKHSATRKMTPEEKDEMYQHYKKELKRIKKLRADGIMGMSHTVSWF